MIQPTLINLHHNEYSRYYPFAVNLDRYVGMCITLDDLSNRLCVPDKTKDLKLNVFIMITGINVSLVVVNVTQIKSRIKTNVNVNVKAFKRAKKIIIAILQQVFVGMVNI